MTRAFARREALAPNCKKWTSAGAHELGDGS